MNMANIMNFYQRMGILPLKKRVNRDKCSFATKQRMFGVFAIDEILRYRGTRFPGSRTLCHPVPEYAKVCQSMPEYARVCQSIPEYARVCQSMPEYARVARVCQSMPEYA